MCRYMTVNMTRVICAGFSALLLCCVVLAGTADGTGTSDQGNCRHRKKSCSQKPACSKGFNDYYLYCVLRADGSQSQCGFKCRKALSMLLYAPNATGDDFLTCNCSARNTRCIDDQSKVSECLAIVQLARSSLESDIRTDLGCSTVYALCSADETCQARWKRVLKECPAMLLGRSCNRECRDAVSELYALPAGSGFKSCQCDGNGDHEFTNFNCLRYRRHQEPLCSKPLPPEVTTTASPAPQLPDDVSLQVANNTAKSGKYDIVSDPEKNDTVINKNKEEQSADIIVSGATAVTMVTGGRLLWINVFLIVIHKLGL